MQEISRMTVSLSAIFCVVGLAYRLWRAFQHPGPGDLARARGAVGRGVVYAFTLGMLPWEKPARSPKFWVAYVRGVLFHLGAFAGLATLAVSPWLGKLPLAVRIALLVSVGVGLMAGLLGLFMRLANGELRGLSIPDDYVSLILVVIFLAGAWIVLEDPSRRALFWLLSSPMLLYIPLGKIRHCVYFFLSRLYYGVSSGRLGLLEHHVGE